MKRPLDDLIGNEPDGHDERMMVARRMSQWAIGDPSWADTIVDAYLNPSTAVAELDAEGAE